MTERSIESFEIKSPSSSFVLSSRSLAHSRNSLRRGNQLERSQFESFEDRDSKIMKSEKVVQSFSANDTTIEEKNSFWNKLFNSLSLFKKKEKKEQMLFVNNENFNEAIEKLKKERPLEKNKLLPQLILNSKTLVLDFEGTLVYSNREHFPNFDFSFNLVEDNPKTTMYFKIRPNVFKFLEELSKTFEIVIFSSHSKEHGSKILKHIDPSHRISYALYRDKCININKVHYLKSLNRLGREESNVIFIDSNISSGVLQPDNFIEIPKFIDQEDDVLSKIIPFLKWVSTKVSVIPAHQLEIEFLEKNEASKIEEGEKAVFTTAKQEEEKTIVYYEKAKDNKIANTFEVEVFDNQNKVPEFVNPFSNKSDNEREKDEEETQNNMKEKDNEHFEEIELGAKDSKVKRRKRALKENKNPIE